MYLAEVVIPQMFTAFAEDMKYIDNGLHQIQYYCVKCDQSFAVAWGRISGCMGYIERGSHFRCPYCGTHHEKHVAYVEADETVPVNVRLALKTYKDAVVFEVYSSAMYFNKLFNVYKRNYKESFRFDIAKQTAVFSRYHNGKLHESLEFSNPSMPDVLYKSILRFFFANSLANCNQKTELMAILKLLRDTVHKSMEKHLKHKVSHLFVTPGQLYGTFLVPLLNIGYRLKFPDAPNLPSVYREGSNVIKEFLASYMVSHSLESVFDIVTRKKDSVTAIIEATGLPNKAAVRRELGASLFEVGRLVEAFKLCNNYDFAMRVHAGLKTLMIKRNYISNDELMAFLACMRSYYGEVGVVQLVETPEELDMFDCLRLYRQLNEANKLAIVEEKVKLKDLHDWMAKKHRRQNHSNMAFNVPDHIVKRLSMQTNRLKFFLPKESFELLEAGEELHNCVASYGKDVKDNARWIVLIADDKGKLAACLEVNGRQLVQAKIDRNKPVGIDEKLNAEIIAWAEKANLEIKTSDVKKPVEASAEAAAAV